MPTIAEALYKRGYEAGFKIGYKEGLQIAKRIDRNN
jgi:hypothetical protein